MGPLGSPGLRLDSRTFTNPRMRILPTHQTLEVIQRRKGDTTLRHRAQAVYTPPITTTRRRRRSQQLVVWEECVAVAEWGCSHGVHSASNGNMIIMSLCFWVASKRNCFPILCLFICLFFFFWGQRRIWRRRRRRRRRSSQTVLFLAVRLMIC